MVEMKKRRLQMNDENRENMLKAYEKHLKENGVVKGEIEKSVLCAQQFLEFTEGKSGDLVRMFADKYGTSSTDRYQTMHRLWTYLVFSKRAEEASETFKMMDGYDIPDMLKMLLEEKGCPGKILSSVFSRRKPSIHAEEKEKAGYIIEIHRKLREKVDREAYKNALYALHHGEGKKAGNRKRWGKVTKENITQYIEGLKKIRFDEYMGYCLAYRKDNLTEAEMRVLLEKADEAFKIEYDEKAGTIIFDKWPYNPSAYFIEKDPVKKRYHLCHCPWARHAIVENNTLPGDICECGAGFTRRNFFGDIEGDMEHEIRETVLRGDDRCRFLFRLPETWG
jgi:hypothetical protein